MESWTRVVLGQGGNHGGLDLCGTGSTVGTMEGWTRVVPGQSGHHHLEVEVFSRCCGSFRSHFRVRAPSLPPSF